MINVLIADDHAIVRRGLKQILSETPDMIVADEASDAEEALHKALTQDLHVLVLDITMPGRSGLDVLKELKHYRPDLPVLVLSMHAEEQFAVRVLKAGASGYLTKESAPEELVKAIRKAVAGGKYVSASLAETLALGVNATIDQPRHVALSDREFQVMRMLAAGKTPTEIASDLALSVKTVSTYRARILEKMGFTNTAEIIRYAIENQLID
ncbi:MAG: Response regulator UvrY [Anaerolineales bacterium]|nr:Response regulator UvrY [Anaerolineales bacterium]